MNVQDILAAVVVTLAGLYLVRKLILPNFGTHKKPDVPLSNLVRRRPR